MLEACQAIGVTAALGEPGEHSLPASTPITGDVLFSIAPTTPEQADHAIAAAAATFTAWRSTPPRCAARSWPGSASCSPHTSRTSRHWSQSK